MLRDEKKKFGDYQAFYTNFKKNMVLAMFKETGKTPPRNINLVDIFDTTNQYVIPKVRAAIPGIIESIKELSSKGFILYTASGAISDEMKMSLEGMGIIQYFKEFYGPDLINTWKFGSEYYEAIFKHSSVDATKAIIIEDNPRFLEAALEAGANVIQACITGEFKPQFPFYVDNMYDLNLIVENQIKSLKS